MFKQRRGKLGSQVGDCVVLLGDAYIQPSGFSALPNQFGLQLVHSPARFFAAQPGDAHRYLVVVKLGFERGNAVHGALMVLW